MQRANRYISILYRYSQRYFAQQIKEAGLPLEVGEMPFLVQVCRHPGCNQESISCRVRMDKGTVARGICRLEQRGLIIRTPLEDDRRVNQLFATEEGKKVYQSCEKIFVRYHEMLYEGLSEEEINQAVDLLIRMKQNVSKSVCGCTADNED